MYKTGMFSELLYQIITLLLSFIIVHVVYLTIITPNAEAILALQAAQQASNESITYQRSFFVVIKDFEQQACFIFALWVFCIMIRKILAVWHERRLFKENFINIRPGTGLLPEDTRDYARPIQSLDDKTKSYLLPRTLLAGLQRFGSTKNIQDVANTIKEYCENEAEHLESELSMVRYIIWAIPSIGFIGTVRGIGEALGQAHKAVEGDILGVTLSLGVAFNSTFVALIISIVIMFFMHQLQLLQERLVLETQSYCDNNLINHLKV